MIFTSENSWPRFFGRWLATFIALWAGFSGNAWGQALPMRELLAKCAPTVALSTMSSIVQVESRGNVFAVADAGPVNLPWSERKHLVRSYFPGSKQEAVKLVRSLLKAGHTVSLGLSQVNDRNLKRLGLTIGQMFDPCTNLSAGGHILTSFYVRAAREFGPGERALQAAISAYNSGDWDRGIANGYVGQVYRAAGVVPALKLGNAPQARSQVVTAAPEALPSAAGGAASTWWASRAELLKQARDSELTASAQ